MHPGISPPSITNIKTISRGNLPTSQQKELLGFIKFRSLVKLVWVKKKKNQILMKRNHLKSYKICENFSDIFEFHKIVLSCPMSICSMSLEQNLECQYENLGTYQNFAKFEESSQTKEKTLTKTRIFGQMIWKQVVVVLQSSRAI